MFWESGVEVKIQMVFINSWHTEMSWRLCVLMNLAVIGSDKGLPCRFIRSDGDEFPVGPSVTNSMKFESNHTIILFQ